MSVLLKNIDIHSDWNEFLDKKIVSLVHEIEAKILSDSDQTPSFDKILRFLSLPLLDAKVIILGQDPYPQKNVATGRAFEVGNLDSWHTPFKNVSLQNIIRAVVRSHTGNIYKFSEIRNMLSHDLNLLPPNELFKSWERQGVLLINAAFSCRIDSPASHSELWKPFTIRLLKYINRTNRDLIWFLWGNHALASVEGLNIRNKVISYHPSRCQNRENDFLYGKNLCFDNSVSDINWLGE